MKFLLGIGNILISIMVVVYSRGNEEVLTEKSLQWNSTIIHGHEEINFSSNCQGRQKDRLREKNKVFNDNRPHEEPLG